jgi:hypothetical protein
MHGITLFQVKQDQIVAGRLFMEEVDRADAGIEDAVKQLSGLRPQGTET